MPPRKTSQSVQVLLLTQKAEVKSVNLNTAADGTVTIAMIQALMKKKLAPEMFGMYKNKSSYLYMFGYTEGNAGAENKHELPPPYDNVLCFGDILLLCSKDAKSWSSPIGLLSSEYEAFYTRAFGGFEDLDSDGEEEEAEEEVAEVGEEGVVEEEEVEEEEVEEEEEEEEVEEEIVGEEEAVPIRVVVSKKRNRRVAAAPAACGGAAQVYSSYLHVPADQQLQQEDMSALYNREALPSQRQKVYNTLSTLFKDLLSEEEIQKLERCIYNGAVKASGQRHIGKAWSHNPFVEMYMIFAKHIAANFHPTAYVGNTELFARYKSGEITFKDISEMDTYQLFEDRWKDSFAQQQVREKRQLEGNKSMATDQFLCMRCHKRECTYYEMQTRSADEPMTIFITCLNCGKHWRQ